MSAGPGERTALEQMIAQLWERSRPEVETRLLQLARAAREATAGTLTAEARADAAATAHKLTGSLGMFGFPEGSALARELEGALTGDGPLPGPPLATLVARLRQELGM